MTTREEAFKFQHRMKFVNNEFSDGKGMFQTSLCFVEKNGIILKGSPFVE